MLLTELGLNLMIIVIISGIDIFFSQMLFIKL